MNNKPLRSFGRRKSRKLSDNAQTLFNNYLPEVTFTTDKIEELKKTYKKINLEIGFGHGEHLFHNAQKHTDEFFIGAEPYINGIVALLRKMYKNKTANIKIYADDVRELLIKIPNATLDKIYILFPDPWPKARQNKKRLFNPDFLNDIIQKLVADGEIIFASDNLDYIENVEAITINAKLRYKKETYTAKCDIANNAILQSKYALKARSNSSIITVLRIVTGE